MSGETGYSAPQFFEPPWIGCGVPDGVLNVSMSEIILNDPGVGSLVGKREAASMTQHVGMGREGQDGGFAANLQLIRAAGRSWTRMPAARGRSTMGMESETNRFLLVFCNYR